MKLRQPEREFQSQVVKLAQLRGWKVAHFRGVRVQRRDGSCFYQTPVQADGAGFPDLVLAKGSGLSGRILFVELKTGRNKQSAEQLEWERALRGGGGETFCWYPEDWPQIEKELSDERH